MGLNEKGAIHLLLPLVVLVIAGVLVSNNIPTTSYPNNQIKGVSLAKNDNGNSGNSNRASSSNNSGSQGNQGGRSEEAKANQETRTTGNTKTETKDNQTKTTGSQKTTQTETKNQQKSKSAATTKTGTESGTEASESADEGDLQDLRSISKFPLRIDLATNQLIMTKNGVERVLTVLPAKAVQNMLRAHLKKGLGPKFFEGATPSGTPVATSSAEPSGTPSASTSPDSSATPSASPTEEPIATGSGEITVFSNQITLEETDGQIVYKIPARKQLRLFGLFPINTDLTGYVSAETGAVIKEQQSLLSQILNLLSP